MAGAILVLCGYGLPVWAIWSWPALFVGHAILPDHQLVRTGVYGVVRHPAYLAAFVIWLGFGIAFRSVGVVALTALYVIPAYLAYIRSEENDDARGVWRHLPGVLPGRAGSDPTSSLTLLIAPSVIHHRSDVVTRPAASRKTAMGAKVFEPDSTPGESASRPRCRA